MTKYQPARLSVLEFLLLLEFQELHQCLFFQVVLWIQDPLELQLLLLVLVSHLSLLSVQHHPEHLGAPRWHRLEFTLGLNRDAIVFRKTQNRTECSSWMGPKSHFLLPIPISQHLFFINIFWGAYPAMIRGYFWLCPQKLLLVVSGDHIYGGIKPVLICIQCKFSTYCTITLVSHTQY